jgi:alkanesulfonate monooxygenase SsuD/methylene tetrahydromethanopterin reductase-like flavin-dependent oxidoreductase (luciferase family)
MTDETIQAMRALWSDGISSFEGKHFKYDPLHSYPKPVKKNVPIHVGGHSLAAARRVGRYGDGFFPTIVNPEKLKEPFALVRSEAEKSRPRSCRYRVFEHGEIHAAGRPQSARRRRRVASRDTSAGNQSPR